MVMSPIKSLSLIVGIGPGPLGVEGASNCDFCTIRGGARIAACAQFSIDWLDVGCIEAKGGAAGTVLIVNCNIETQ